MEDPGSAKAMGRTRAVPLRADWELVKDEIMYRCVLAKFQQHKQIRLTLLSTGDATLVEHTKNGLLLILLSIRNTQRAVRAKNTREREREREQREREETHIL